MEQKSAKKLVIVIGAYGSGKSEYAINLAKEFKDSGEEVMLADMDVVNPYFRSRDVREQFEKNGITVIAPEGEFMHADVPMMNPRIMGAIQQHDKTVVLDVGGDPAGCRTMARFVQNIKIRGYEMHFVINTKRPFTSNKEDIIGLLHMLEGSSQLRITHLVSNTNLMEHTDAEVVEAGIKIVNEVAVERDLPFERYLVLKDYDAIVPDNLGGKKKKVLSYFLNKPWEDAKIRGKLQHQI